MKYCLILVLVSLCTALLTGQPVGYSSNCDLTQFNGQPIPIMDQDTISLRFNVTEANLPDLAGFQSICGVRLNFEHHNLSDLEISLTSPNGQRVTLVGPATPNGTQPSPPLFPINFDVYFVARPAADDPHPFLMSPWSNNLGATWLQASDYSGIYYPQNGDLAVNFDTGTVLGIWELTIIDRFLNDEGLFKGFEIDFCENGGLVCNVCESEEGSFVDTLITYCVTDELDINGIFNPGSSDLSLYSDEFLIYDEQGNLVSTDEPGLGVASLDSGVYYIHGLNILTTEYDTAGIGLQSLSRNQLVDSVEALGGVLCMSLSRPLQIQLSIPDTTTIDTILCFGDSILFDGVVIKETGQYTNSSSDCASIEVLNVQASNMTVSLDRDTVRLDCTPEFFNFTPTVNNPSGSVTYEWSLVNDLILSIDQTYALTDTGAYQVRVSDDLCDTTLFFYVERPGDDYAVDLSATPTQLNCVADSSNLVYTSNFITNRVIWYRDGIQIAEDVSIITIFDEARYSVEIFGERGCIIRDTVDITTSQNAPVATVNYSDITCTQESTTATYTTSNNISSAIWMAGSDTLNIGPDLVIDSGGDYSLILIGDNLCSEEFPFTVQADVDPLIINGVPDGEITLNCDMPTLVIEPDRDPATIVDEYWIMGVDDTLRIGKDITINEANSYRYQVITTNGCNRTERFDVVVDTMTPSYTLILDSVTCQNLTPEIVITNMTDDVSVSFSGSTVLTQTDSSAIVSGPGVLSFTVTNNSNGCFDTDSYDVPIDESIPDVTISGDTLITCTTTEARIEADFNGVALSEFFWVSPLADTTLQRTFVTTDTGYHVFTGVGFNGCILKDSFLVQQNDDVPNIALDDELVINCASPNATIELTDLTEIQAVRWIVDNDTLFGTSLDRLTRANSIEVLVTGDNNCPNSKVIDILYDTLNPQVALIADTLNCTNSDVTIQPNVPLMNHEFTWAGLSVAGETTQSVVVSLPGAYALNVMDTISGCDTLVVIDIMEDYSLPTYSVLPPETITCDRTSANLSVQTDTRNAVNWTTGMGNTLIGPTVLSGDIGKHIFTIEGTNGCTAIDSLDLIADMTAPAVLVENTYVISCRESSFDITPDILDPFRSVVWIYKNGTTTSSLSQTIQSDDLESVVVTGDNGCPTEVTFDISLSEDNPIAVINTPDSIECDGQPIDIETNPVLSINHRIFWTSGGVLLDQDITRINASASGEYILEVIDTSSGCGSFDTVNLVIAMMPLTGFEGNVIDETCLGSNDGFIVVNSVNGGAGQYELTLDGEDIILATEEARAPGTYQLRIEDLLGCTFDSTLSILGGGSLTVDLGGDFEIDRGDKATIQALYSGDVVASVSWMSESGQTSTNQDTFCFFPTMDQNVFIEAISVTGCIVYDTVFVKVNLNLDKINMYVPNILAQQSNLGNDRLILSLPEDIIEVNNFSIYDRWGQKVAYLDRLVRGEAILVWDGRFGNQDVASGVYVYTYDMLTTYNDIWLTRNGDITIVK